MPFSLVHKMNWVFLLVLLLSSVGKCDENNHEEKKLYKHEEHGTVEEDPVVDQNRNTLKMPDGKIPMRFKSANLTEEEELSIHMPFTLLCDGCKIIAYTIHTKLARIQDRYKKGHKLLESEVIDILDKACQQKGAFESYGIKEVKGEKRLSGLGLGTHKEPGILQGGGKWPYRLHQQCQQYVGNLGDELIYETFLEGESLEDLFCYNEANRNICNPEAKTTTKKAEKEL